MFRITLVTALGITLWACTPPAGNQAPANPYTLQTNNDPMTQSEIEQAFGQLDLSMHRFTYEAPDRHRIQITIDKYENGVLEADTGGASMTLDAGSNTITVYRRREGNDIIFTTGFSGGWVGADYFSRSGNTAWTSGEFDNPILTSGQAVPIFYLAGNSDSVLGRQSVETIEQMAARFELLIVVNATRLLP